jgi:glycosyltransferase involved in cell wall biosynthesis
MISSSKYISFYSSSALYSGAEKMLQILFHSVVESVLEVESVELNFSNNEVFDLKKAQGFVGKRVEINFRSPLKKISDKKYRIIVYFLAGFCSLFKSLKADKRFVVFNDLESLIYFWPIALFNKSYFYLHDSHKLDAVQGRVICKIISLFVDTILVITKPRMDKLQKIGVLNTVYFPNCVETKNKAKSAAENKKIAITEKIANGERLHAISVGQLTQWKRIEKSIELVEVLNKNGLLVDLHIYGRASGNSEADLAYVRMLESLSSSYCIFEGYKKQLDEVFDRADFLLSMSINEPFGLVIVEALSHNLPVISAQGEGPTEILRDDLGLVLSESDILNFDHLNVEMFKNGTVFNNALSETRVEEYSYKNYSDHVVQIFGINNI